MRPSPRAACCLVLALAACGPDAAREPADAPALAAVASGEPPDPHRAARPVVPPAPRPAALQRALDVLANPDSDAATRNAAITEILAHGAVAAEALIEWLAFDFSDERARFAHLLLRGLGSAAVRPLLAVVRPCGDTQAENDRLVGAVGLLHALQATWSSTDLAADVAAAALALAESGVNDDFRRDCLTLVLDAGPAAAPLAPRLLAQILGTGGAWWLDDLDDRSAAAAVVLASVAAELVPLLAADDAPRWSSSLTILSHLRDPPRAAIDAILAAMDDPDWAGRTRGAEVVAAWSGDDVRLLDATRRLLTDPDAEVRQAALTGWAGNASGEPGDVLLGVRAILDPDEGVRWKAETFVHRALESREDRAAILDAALRRSGTDDALALCTVIASLDETDVDLLVPSLVVHTSSDDPRIRAAALRAIDEAAWDVYVATAPERGARLDDPDPAVRAWAAWACRYDDSVSPDRIAAVALPLVRTLEDPDALLAACEALQSSDKTAALAEARRLLAHPDSGVRGWAETVIGYFATTTGVLSDEVLEPLLRRLRDHDEDERTLAILLRSDNGRDPALAWLDEQLGTGDRRDVVRTLGYVLDGSEESAVVLPSIRRLADREGFADLAAAALVWFETDANAAVRQFEAALPGLDRDAASELVAKRLTNLGPAGAALLIRMDTDPDSWMATSVVRDEPETVRATIAALATSREANDRRIAARWAAVLETSEAMPILRVLTRDTVMGAALDTARDFAAKDPALVPEVAAWHVPALRSGDPNLGCIAAEFLGSVPRLPNGAAEALRSRMGDADTDVSASCAAVLVLHDAGDAAMLRAVVSRLRTVIAQLRTDGRRGHYWGREPSPWQLCWGFEPGPWQLYARAIERAGPAAVAAVPDVGTVLARALLFAGEAPPPLTQEFLVRAAGAVGPAAAPCVPILRCALFREIGLSDEGRLTSALSAPAARALGRIGAPAAPAIPDLRRLARDPRFRAVAEEAIRAIEAAPGER